MGTFGNEFDTTKPVGSDQANTLDTIIEAKVKKSLAERYELEHIALNSAQPTSTDKTSAVAQGRHLAGAVSVLLTGTSAEIDTFANDLITAGTPPGTGALALADGNVLKYFNGTQFVVMGLTAEIYTAGVGIVDPITDGVINVDFANEAAISTGTSPTKVTAVADLRWAYGLTETMELSYSLINTAYAAVPNNFISTIPLNTEDIPGTIIGGSFNGGTSTIILPAGVYEVDVVVMVDSVNQSSVAPTYYLDMYDVTNSEIKAVGLINRGFRGGNTLQLMSQITVTSTTEFTFRIQVTFSGSFYGVSGGPPVSLPEYLNNAMPVAKVRIRKKKIG